ncbi:YdcF family protein [Gloeobacter morelensis]|uniref:YdcF family protein n=1 Tax=Gloeobacter morelensis MG652769 TaxID=2781736 RepID=A0ABY3PKJ9_9CYAN|nr:YdcF family protein [Gloeobacter morelensis]UFP94201.1 YdcF family protein [Gloeobacter morelensis MG652769]
MFIYLGKVLPLLFYPLGLSVVLTIAAALAFRFGRAKLAIWLCGAIVLLLGTFSAPIVADALLWSLESQHPEVPVEKSPTAQAIVVLGGALHLPNARHRTYELAEASDRVLHAARLFKAKKAPVVLMSGGNPPFHTRPDQPPEATQMAAFARELGVPAGAILTEERSWNTFQNAALSAEVLKPRRIERILLVTSASHMPRSVAIFERAGFAVIAASTDVRSGMDLDDWLLAWLPSAAALESSTLALKEWVGLLVYRLRGWA